MKLRNIIMTSAFGLVSSVAFAQTGVATNTPFGSGQDSIKCRQDLSLLTSYAKAGSYADAYNPWKSAYEACPASSKNIYIFGAKILGYMIEQEKDAKKKQEYIDKLMQMYDSRVKYFGNDEKYGADVIVGAKVADYTKYMSDKADYNTVYNWVSPIVQQYKENTSAQTLFYFSYASQALARADEKKIPTYINDFMLADKYLNDQLEKADGDAKAVDRLNSFKTSMETSFASSGLASCEMLQKVYTTDAIEQNKTNKEYLTLVTGLFQGAGCDAPVYYLASKHLFNIEPTANAAMGLAGEAISDKKYDAANEWLKKAIDLSKDNMDRSKCYELLAQIAQLQNNWGAARTYSNQALSENPKSGKSYILQAQMIASSAGSLYPDDPIKQKCVYFLVLDKLAKAASVDPSVAAKANSLAASYRRYLPSASDIFMHPDLNKGSSFSCGSWGTTTIR